MALGAVNLDSGILRSQGDDRTCVTSSDTLVAVTCFDGHPVTDANLPV